jgi:DNA-binding MarR family transcriptional regulator
LADELGIAPPAMSKHLRVLLAAGIVVDERVPEDARARVFRLQPDSVVAVRAWLDQLQAHWDEQLGSFRAHVERRMKR